MLTKIVLLFVLLLPSLPAAAQVGHDQQLVEATIQKLFTAMAKGDSALLRTAFAERVTMATISLAKDGSPVMKRETGIADFMRAIGTPHPEPYSEPIWNLKVDVDGRFAQAWCDYAFYVGKKFSHCGVDAFHLYKDRDSQWKIFHLADTRRKDGCDVPEHIAQQFR